MPRLVMRYVYLGVLLLSTAAMLLQAFSAGRYIFGVAADNSLHAAVGWPFAHAFSALILLTAVFTKSGWRTYAGSAVAVVLLAVLPILAVANEKGPAAVEAFHPPLAMVILGLLLWLDARAIRLVREAHDERAAQATAPAAAPTARPMATGAAIGKPIVTLSQKPAVVPKAPAAAPSKAAMPPKRN